MEKRKAHYQLSSVIALVQARGIASFTKTAIDGGRQMGFTSSEMIAIVCGLKPQWLYKSMTTYVDPTVWQDVYHAPSSRGMVYIKVTLRENGAPVIQFKELQHGS
jgi:motility quorum-sensing regulator/GCU-specific mRNA interferase toxin